MVEGQIKSVDFKDIITKEANTLKYVATNIDYNQVLQVFNLIKSCQGKVIISGCGTSGMGAKKIAHTLNVVEQPAFYLSPADTPHGGGGVVGQDDLVILISKGGQTEEINKVLKICKNRKAKIIGITEKADSFLAQNSDCILQIIVDQEADDFHMMATSSTLAVISVFDAISVMIARNKHYSQKEFLEIHPGGEVGQKLKLNVDK
ncbi:SIS domain-containing protein [uncultured Lactobacillus sp.]|uniref:KpsF/GutQ family sugar-phosphate isomerase n=1 Tax=uncultured Lactobacillus sp. TaxID=153152 RepID=UPI002600D821|nr:SIS domain-containing protein [uncultured Lactobacillus sp.]